MTAALFWRPENTGKRLPDELRMILDKQDMCSGVVLDRNDTNYLRGLQHGGVKGASELLAAISKHDRVVLEWRS